MKWKCLILIFGFSTVHCCTLYGTNEFNEFSQTRDKRDLTTNCGPDDEIPPNRVNTTQRLLELRNIMENHEIDAYYVPNDEVGRRSWISGFSGSNGDAIVTRERVSVLYLLSASDNILLCIKTKYVGLGLDRRTILFTSVSTIGLQLGIDENGPTQCPNLH